MKISVIIPTYNAAGYLPGLMKALKAQSLMVNPAYETTIWVVDSSSPDGSLELARSLGAKTLSVAKETFDHGGTRAWAGRQTDGEILVYMTQDALPADDHALEAILKPFQSLQNGQKVGGAYGRQLPYDHASLFSAHSRYFIYQDKPFTRTMADKDRYKIKTAFLSNAFSAYLRQALEETGWFKENLISTEDTYSGAKMLMAGYCLAYAADACVKHSHNYTVWQEFQRYFDIGSFHKNEHWIVEAFGGATGEGLGYVKSELAYLMKHGAVLRLPEFFIRNAMKWLGYKLGNNFQIIPYRLRLKLSMHRGWWVKNHKTDGENK